MPNIGDAELLARIMGVIYWVNSSSGMILDVVGNRNSLHRIVHGGGGGARRIGLQSIETAQTLAELRGGRFGRFVRESPSKRQSR